MHNRSRFVVVTGGTGVLGTAVTAAFLKKGYQVAVPYIHEREIERFEKQLGDLKAKVTLIRANVTVEAGVKDLFQTVLDEFGQIDILANIVGGFIGGFLVSEMDEEKWDFMMDMNLKSVFLCCKAALRHMTAQQYGKIVNVSARAGLSGIGGLGAYCVSKSGGGYSQSRLRRRLRIWALTSMLSCPVSSTPPATGRQCPTRTTTVGFHPAKSLK
jgi:3-oxoacyl-[acyl-carrier protein] reductase